MGGADILVNNAGLQHVAPVEEFPEERYVRTPLVERQIADQAKANGIADEASGITGSAQIMDAGWTAR